MGMGRGTSLWPGWCGVAEGEEEARVLRLNLALAKLTSKNLIEPD